jgi:Na+/melibiose symporter-like transporter
MRQSTFLSILATAAAFLFCKPAMAYIGPGAGITLLGAIWSVIAAIFLALGAVLFWPVRILFRRRRNRAAKVASEKAASVAPPSDSGD